MKVGILVGVIVCAMMSLSLWGQDVTGTNMTLTGTADIAGNALYLGTHSGSPSTSGLTLGFFDGSTTTIGFTASAASNLWQWQQNASGTLATQMSLSGSNTLALYNSTGTVVISLSPTGVSSISGSLTVGGTLTVSGTNNQMPNQTLVGANSVVTEGLGDARYLQLRSGGYIGIGTSTPVTQLQVGSGTGLDSSAVASFYGSTTAGGVISVGSSDASKQAEVGVDGTAGYLKTVSNQPIQFRPNSTTAMTITGSGNVGIGTASPSSLLHVLGNGDSQPLMLVDNYDNSGAVTTPVIRLRAARGTAASPSNLQTDDLMGAIAAQGYTDTGYTGYDLAKITFSAAQNLVGINEGAYIGFYTNGSGGYYAPGERMRIAGNGNIGIGTTAPATVLSVVGNGDSMPLLTVDNYDNSGTVNNASFMGRSARGTISAPTALQADDTISGWAGRGYLTSGFSFAMASINFKAAQNLTNVNEGAYIQFITNPNSSGMVAAERMRIDQNGNIGIGTTTPSTKLEVNGATKVDGAVTATGSITATTFITTAPAGDIPMFTGH